MREKNREALKLAVAIHTYNAKDVNYQCSFAPCDQIDWQRRWALIVRKYNTNGHGYTFSQTSDDRITTGNLNYIVQRAITDYDARWR